MCVRYRFFWSTFCVHASDVYIEFLCMLWGIDSHTSKPTRTHTLRCIHSNTVRFVLLHTHYQWTANTRTHCNIVATWTEMPVYLCGYFGFLSGSHHSAKYTNARTPQSNAWQLYTHTNAHALYRTSVDTVSIHTFLFGCVCVCACSSRSEMSNSVDEMYTHSNSTYFWHTCQFDSSRWNEARLLW